jgi:hypothetical protein
MKNLTTSPVVSSCALQTKTGCNLNLSAGGRRLVEVSNFSTLVPGTLVPLVPLPRPVGQWDKKECVPRCPGTTTGQGGTWDKLLW